jgi:hypothetical protein
MALRPLTAAALVVAVTWCAGATAAPPRAGTFEPGTSLGGLRLGMTAAEVRAAWGTNFGRCRGCAATTWYFNYAPFAPEGVGVEFRRGLVDAIFTLWSPAGWRTRAGLRIGDDEARVNDLYGALTRAECGSYRVLLSTRGRVVSAFAIVSGRVWGFALFRAPSRPCR